MFYANTICMGLDAYRSKRNFDITTEPYGKKTDKGGVFSVQYHEARRTHYDLRLEHGGVLLSWAVPKCPSFDPKIKRLAVKVEDHPVDYAHFEGEIPKGQYGGGKVTLWDKGSYEQNCDFDHGLKSGELKFTLFGKRLKGSWTLIKTDWEQKDNWLLIKEKDGFANAKEITDTTSILSKKHSADTLPFSNVELKQATAVDSVPLGKKWLYEIKYDGYRMAAFISDSSVKLITRNGNDVTKKFAPIATAITEFFGGKTAILDGEVAVIKNGKTDFGALQRFTDKDELCYIVFDLLALKGKDLRPLPLLERKKKLKALLKNAPPMLSYSEHFDSGQELFDSAASLGLEGIVCKKADAPYFSGDWLKLKCRNRQEFVILGYTQGKKEISSLLLGVYQGGVLTYVGSVGTGISSKTADMLKKEFIGLESEAPTAKVRKKDVCWLKPVLMAEVEFAEWTESGKIRQASYKGFRRDKSALGVKNEDPSAILGITITSPDKQIFAEPPISKLEVARYYESVASLMLPYLVGRPISVMRCNSGIEKCFYKKHPGIDKNELIYINSVSDIIRQVQLGTVEFHIQCYVGNNNIMVFDLDPDENLSLSATHQGVSDLKKTLSSFDLKSFIKTSGGKGYHIFVPMNNKMTGEEFSSFAKSVAALLAAKFPDRYTANIKKDRRGGKIFIDWQRNTAGATTVAPYSLRAKRGASVSFPLPWSAVNSSAPNGINIFSAPSEIKKRNPWQGFFSQN